MLKSLTTLRNAKTARFSSWDVSGRNYDAWKIEVGHTRVLADIQGPGCITHIWMTQANHYRECLIKITFDNAQFPSVLAPLGDFFGLGHGIVNSYQSLLFTASTAKNNEFGSGCALNGYVQMPFRERAVVELVNESKETHVQYFYIDYETYGSQPGPDMAYFHAEFRRENPFGGWGNEIGVNTTESNIVNQGREAWDNNYVILEAKGRGHYIGCNLSVTHLHGSWWGEGDDMIWVDGYKWPPDLHGTGSEDYLGQAWGMQPNAFLRNGASIWERNTAQSKLHWHASGGYLTCYVYHLENPVHFSREIKVTIEHGHGNHLRNEMSSVAYWYADQPYAARPVPPVEKRMPIMRDADGNWVIDPKAQTTSREIVLNHEMKSAKTKWAERGGISFENNFEPIPLLNWEWAGPFTCQPRANGEPDIFTAFPPEKFLQATGLTPDCPGLWKPCDPEAGIIDFTNLTGIVGRGVCYARLKLCHKGNASVPMGLRIDFFGKLWVNGKLVVEAMSHAGETEPIRFSADLYDGINEILVKVYPGTGGHRFAVNLERRKP